MTLRERIATHFYHKFLPEIKQIQKRDEKHNWKELCQYVTTINDKAYYRFENSSQLPIVRYEQLQVKLIELSKRLTKEEEQLLLSIAETSLDNAYSSLNIKGKASNIQTAIFSIQEMKNRHEKLMFHPQILIELCALSLIREDEIPYVINEDIHTEKIAAFTSEMPSDAFFLHLSLSDVFPDYEQFKSKLTELWSQHLLIIERAQQTYKAIHLSEQS